MTPALLPYQYVTLRCVPRVDREEFVNVGVVLYCQEADLLLTANRVRDDLLRVFAPGLDLDALCASLRQVDAVCRGGLEVGGLDRMGARFGWIAAPRSTVLQAGPRHGGLTGDPRAELERLLDRLVAPSS